MKMNSKKTTFTKLYPYYCRKLLAKIPLIIFYLVLFGGFIGLQLWISLRSRSSNSEIKSELSEWFNIDGWTKILMAAWVCSLLSLGVVYGFGSMLTTELVGGYMGGQIRFLPKKSSRNGEDIKTLLFTPSIKRTDIIWAKLAAVLTYLSVIILVFFTLPLLLYLAIFLKVSLIYLPFFLVFHGIIFTLSNLSLLVPLLFFVNAKGSLTAMILFLIGYLCLVNLIIYFFWNFIVQYLFFMLIPYVLFSLLVGYLFFSLWKRDFLSKDLA